MSISAAAPEHTFTIRRRRRRFLDAGREGAIRYFFGVNALVSVIVLALITVFLFREGAEFFPQNRQNLRLYRLAGLEFVDLIRAREAEHSALTRLASDIRLREFQHLQASEGLTAAAANARLQSFDAFADALGAAIDPLRTLLFDLSDAATAIKTSFLVNEDNRVARRQLELAGQTEEAAAIPVRDFDFTREIQPLLAARALIPPAVQEVTTGLEQALALAPPTLTPGTRTRWERLRELGREYIAGFPEFEDRIATWDQLAPIPWHRQVSAFIFGREWITASSWQDWYGIVPLFTGSLLVSGVALALAIPLGVGAAIYLNQMAHTIEQRVVKPVIEFIAAIPSVVLGFFGIAVLGETLRAISQIPWLSWMPGFPFSERLNVLTAGCLLGLIAVPTIFTLAEDALNNVPRAMRDASLALGATRLQTVFRIILPASLSGIISAVLLGFGRVIGETMVVLLCAGNRIAIPDFSAGLGVITQPVHTMTGIIAQEMGEVVSGSIHYRALFVVGLTLFFLSLMINFGAQRLVRRYRLPSA